MRDGHHGARIAVKELFEPKHRLGVQMVGRLVEKQQVGSLEQQAAERHATPLATGEHADRRVGVGALQRIHCLRELAVQVPAICGINLVLQFAHLVHQCVKVRIMVRHLFADCIEAVDLGDDVREGLLDVLADGLVLLERRGLAHAVGTDHADLGAGKDAHRHVIEDDLVANSLTSLVHLVHELCHTHSFSLGYHPSVAEKEAYVPCSRVWQRSPALLLQLVHASIVGEQAVGLLLHVRELRVHIARKPLRLERVHL